MNKLDLILSPEATNHFKKMTNNDKFIHLGLKEAGCSGYKYTLDINENSNLKEGEDIYEIQNLKFIVKKENLPYFNNCIVELKKEGLNQRINFENPNAKNLLVLVISLQKLLIMIELNKSRNYFLQSFIIGLIQLFNLNH